MEGEELTHLVTRIVLQLCIILVAAKVAGEISQRYLKIPSVLGELGAGIIIGPFALGGVEIGSLGPIFEATAHIETNPIAVIPTELWVIAQIASIVLLFTVGLETDLKQFFKFAGPATAVAIGGVLLPFSLGAGATVLLGYADDFTDPVALFMGAIMTATSVGITARVLSDLNRMGSPEGVTIIGAAVVDDVLGILVLAVVVGMAETGSVSIGEIGEVAGKAVGFWIILTGVMILGAGLITRVLRWFNGVGTALVLVLALDRGETAYLEVMAWLSRPAVLATHVLVLLMVLFHAITWFNLAPMAIVAKIGGWRVPASAVLFGHYAAWLVCTGLVAWVLIWR